MNTEQFVRDATRGLSRRKRAEAQAELRSHLHERTKQLVLAGQPLASAQAQAMQELGAPGEIARGLRRVEHVHPLLSAAVLAAMAGILLGFPALDAWQGWRNNEDSRRIARSEAQLRQEGLVSLPEARDQLQKSGIDLKFFGPWAARLEAPGLPTVKLDMSCQQPAYADPRANRLMPEVRPAHLYVSPEMLTGCLANAGWPLELRPDSVLFRGKIVPYLPQTLPSGSKVSLEQFQHFLQGVLYEKKVENLMGRSYSLGPYSSGKPVTYRVAAPAHTPVMLLVRASNSTTFQAAFNAFRWVGADQTVELPTEVLRDSMKRDSTQPIILTDSLAEWRSAPAFMNSGILVPLSTNTADPIRLQPLKLTPIK